jgi:transcriptional regulator with XRE-family HTH domain
MAGEDPGKPRTLAEKISWLMDTANPAGRPYTIQDVCDLVFRVTGEKVSHTTVWKLSTGEQSNPSRRVIGLLSRSFGVAPGFFFDDYGPEALGLDQDQAELVGVVRESGMSPDEFRLLLGLGSQIAKVADVRARHRGGGHEDAPGS